MILNNFITLHLDLINLKINKKKSRECLNKECKKQAVFNYKNYLFIKVRKHIYCKIHKLENIESKEEYVCDLLGMSSIFNKSIPNEEVYEKYSMKNN